MAGRGARALGRYGATKRCSAARSASSNDGCRRATARRLAATGVVVRDARATVTRFIAESYDRATSSSAGRPRDQQPCDAWSRGCRRVAASRDRQSGLHVSSTASSQASSLASCDLLFDRSADDRKLCSARSTGSSDHDLRLRTSFADAALPVPPLDEQAAIVRFLDHADRRIRRYIRAKQKLIELLEEQKQAIIHRAVTRGLDPNVRLKPSGVEWLGEVPEHGRSCASSRLFRAVDRTDLRAPTAVPLWTTAISRRATLECQHRRVRSTASDLARDQSQLRRSRHQHACRRGERARRESLPADRASSALPTTLHGTATARSSIAPTTQMS